MHRNKLKKLGMARIRVHAISQQQIRHLSLILLTGFFALSSLAFLHTFFTQ
ncbi:hypothetical protein MNBD_GAMMA11-3478 [hydrothermal vent metagenome]|uniref:Uncharacterized protein n=1 Tax=hydrothermal vent metagenome TaxID=652676 RepID=A0A3B0XFC8_9ZZZZ